VACKHLKNVKPIKARSDGCEECLKIGDKLGAPAPVHGLCHVGCCDSSKEQACEPGTSTQLVTRSSVARAWRAVGLLLCRRRLLGPAAGVSDDARELVGLGALRADGPGAARRRPRPLSRQASCAARSDPPLAAWWSAAWIGLSLVFGLVILVLYGRAPALTYLTAYLLEKFPLGWTTSSCSS